MMGVFGVLRGLVGHATTRWSSLSTIGIAVAQPFLLDAWTKVPANWFARRRARDGRRPHHAGQHARRRPSAWPLSPVLVGVMSIATHAARVRRRGRGLGRRLPRCSRASGRRRRPDPPGRRSGRSCSTASSTRSPSSRSSSSSAVAFVIMGVFNGVTTLGRRHHPAARVRRRPTPASWARSCSSPASSAPSCSRRCPTARASACATSSSRSRSPSRASSASRSSPPPGCCTLQLGRARLLHRRRAADRHAVRRRGHVPDAGGHVERPRPAVRPVLGGRSSTSWARCAPAAARSRSRWCS